MLQDKRKTFNPIESGHGHIYGHQSIHQPQFNISAAVNQNIFVQQNRTQYATDHPRYPTHPGHTQDHEYVDLTLDDEEEFSSDTETGSVRENGDLDEDDYLDDEEFEALLGSWNDHNTVEVRNPTVQQPTTVTLKEYNGLAPEMAVRLSDGNLMRIKRILRLFNGDIYLQGFYFRKLTDLSSPFPQRHEELCWIVERDATGIIHFEKEVAVSAVLGTSTIVLTNNPWHSRVVRNLDSWICRLIWQSTKDKGEWIVRYLTFEEADEGHSTPSHVIREQWRGPTIPFGSETVSFKNSTSAYRRQAKSSIRFQRQYSFGDAFCGAGGVSLGAYEANLRVKYGVDIDKAACETWRTNFLHSWCYHADFYSWLSLHDNEEMRVDISHTSPPCQPFSPAHTRSYNVQRDEDNSSLVFSAFNMIQKVRPRIHTIEETFGIPSRFKETFCRMIQDILELGYSIHSKTISCEKYGIPQTRKRLFIIAAGPGEKLPAFPTPTHGEGLLPYVTIKDVINSIPRAADNHDIESTVFLDGYTKVPYDENSLAKTVTCGGGEKNYHPSGLRNFTIRELASIQTFSPLYKFPTSYAKKQIGNSVPPRLARIIYQAVVRSLQETDEQDLRRTIVID